MRWPRLLYFLPAILLFIGFFHHNTSYDQDLGRHLLTGKIILQNWHVPTTNLFSYTYPDFPFINHHWGSEVIFYFIHTVASDLGLFVLSLILIFIACGLIFNEARKKAAIIPLVITSLIYLRILFERTDIRPELFSFAFLAAIIVILYRYREKYTRLIFLLPLLELAWTNTHIYFPIGVFAMLLFLIDETITHRKKLNNYHSLTLLGVFVAMGITTLINPHFLTGALYPLHVFQNYGYTIEENQTPFFLQTLGFHKPSFLYLEIGIVLLFGSLCIAWRKTKPIDWLLAIVFTIIALMAVRNFPLFVFATFIPGTIAFSHAVEPVAKFVKSKPPIWVLIICTLLLGFFIWQVQSVKALRQFDYGVDIGGEKALDFVEAHHIQGPIFNNFDMGSYIESRLYPKEKVFIDGRPEAYPASFIQNTYIKMQQNPASFAQVDKRYNFNVIIFSHTDQTPWAEQFLTTIIQNRNWSTVYLDSTMIILLKKTLENEPLIQKYGMDVSHLTTVLPQDETHLRQLAHFYATANLTPQLEQTLLKLISLKPTDCTVLGLLAQSYTQDKNPAASVYGARYQLNCMK